MTDPQPTNGNGSGLSGADMLALITHMSNLLGEMEGRIMDRLSDNAKGATERWKEHDRKAEHEMGLVREEIGLVRADLNAHLVVANAHFKKEEKAEIANEARVKPVLTVAQWIVKNWKSIALAILALAGILGWAGLETHVLTQ